MYVSITCVDSFVCLPSQSTHQKLSDFIEFQIVLFLILLFAFAYSKSFVVFLWVMSKTAYKLITNIQTNT